MTIRLALPKGELQDTTARLLASAGFHFPEYNAESRVYRLNCAANSSLTAKVFHEKDIPIQVAIGNYDIGLCGYDWVEELMIRYSSSNLIKLRDFNFGKKSLSLVSSVSGGINCVEDLIKSTDAIRVVSEYPNIAEMLALRLRLRNFRIFPVWGVAESYLPDNADAALIGHRPATRLEQFGFRSILQRLKSTACLIVNSRSWATRDLSPVVQPLTSLSGPEDGAGEADNLSTSYTSGKGDGTGIYAFNLALPNGHQREPAVSLLDRAGITVPGYTSRDKGKSIMEGISYKVIRPQDMPLQVASGNFDAAITGRDWFWEHLYRFPSSPAEEILDLDFGRVKIVAVVTQDTPVSTVGELREYLRTRARPLSIASEYVNIADKFARDFHLHPYRVIPTWGATEAFLPDDADLLIENTQTGRTLAKHDLKIIHTLFESSACLIVNRQVYTSSPKRAIAEKIAKLLKGAL